MCCARQRRSDDDDCKSVLATIDRARKRMATLQVAEEFGEHEMYISKSIRGLWLAPLASLSIAPIGAMAASDNGTITVGSSITTSVCSWGYLPPTYGSYSPSGLTGGKTVADLFAIVVGPSCTGTINGQLLVSGFALNPGQSWLVSVACNGTTKTRAPATYTYSSGTAQWSWGATSWGFPSKVGSQLACTIVHD